MTPDLMTVLGIGLTAGIVSGFFGIGGGTLIVPALVLLLRLPIHIAVGTSLGALLPPVGLLGAWKYYQQGQLNIMYAVVLGIGLMLGVYFGAQVAVHVSGPTLRRAFAIFLILLSIRMLV